MNLCLNFIIFKKCKKMFHGLGQDNSCIKFLEVSENGRKEANILDRCGLPLNWGGGGGGKVGCV